MKLPTRLAPPRVIRKRNMHRLTPEEVLIQKEAAKMHWWN